MRLEAAGQDIGGRVSNASVEVVAVALAHAEPYRWTIDEFERLFTSGLLPDDARVELIDGVIVRRPMMNPPHGNAVMHANNLMVTLFGETHWVRVQSPVNYPPQSQPWPDLALIRKGYDQSSHPSQADLLIEVADSSLAYDRGVKVDLYARAGSREFWIVNLVDHVLEVFRDPKRSKYTTRLVLKPEDEIAPLMAPDVRVRVKDLF